MKPKDPTLGVTHGFTGDELLLILSVIGIIAILSFNNARNSAGGTLAAASYWIFAGIIAAAAVSAYFLGKRFSDPEAEVTFAGRPASRGYYVYLLYAWASMAALFIVYSICVDTGQSFAVCIAVFCLAAVPVMAGAYPLSRKYPELGRKKNRFS
ncbi:hypothetical protein AUQ37_04555 [Candidatus Methanomethylophilus sp. 1R26]|jgi:hypothetical protein|uniref:DUF4133 domain-containing protein n=1 Tax=Candidatus Methanomethylophilus sp. 1R26 TaxID=1769296 RepID=UPI000736AACB|nr:DUF4133 domain-containing protein [Candidatus Methanomethylophilus sp. 1R26]MCH3978092.1 DUF4133 domain-containing protein [Methanomethylophilus sp.]TQS78771.1 MAG: hypothetical protein A3Q59_00125 [Methanomethylophilus alvi]KUE74378.1 hypothetical protein AUQ37_04555 [Candidatus Methanomethylophilus sp. 1R26]MCI2074422.1 DUF4133 domain-containing protein [Methanomethylophilus sp.]MCI2092781.1 DUF4133 domain-containing protein [Methanomethylophilus sp.]